MEMFSLDELLVIRDIAHYGSISHASKMIHISSSSLSRALQGVERELGVELFWRNGRHLVLNDFGKILIHHCDAAEKTIESTLGKIEVLKESNESLIRVYFRHSLGNVSKALAPFIRMNKDIQLDIILSGKEASEKGYDLEFVSSKEPIDEPGTFLLAEEHYVLVVNNKHKLATAPCVSIGDLQGETFIVPPIGQGRKLLENLCREHGFLPRKRINCPQVWGALHYVEQNIGVLIAPELSMLAGINSDDVTKVPLVSSDGLGPVGTRYLYVLVNEKYQLTSQAQNFISYLKEMFSSAT